MCQRRVEPPFDPAPAAMEWLAPGIAADLSFAPQGSADNRSLADAIRAATIGNAELFGLENEIGSLTAGKRADICVVDDAGELQQVWRRGERIR